MKATIQIFTMVVLFIGATLEINAQWNTTGNNITGTEWFGADLTSTIALDIRHRGNRPMLFSTNNIERMRIAEYGNVGIGNLSTVAPKLHVFLDNNNASFGIGAFRSYAIVGENFTSGLANYNVGVYGFSTGANWESGIENVAGSFEARYAWRNVAVDGLVGSPSPSEEEFGAHGWAARYVANGHTQSNYGVSARAVPHPNYLGAHVVAIAGGVDGGGTDMWAGWFEGDMYVSGTYVSSDESLKQNIEPLSNALDIISDLQPKTYQYAIEEYPFMQFPDGDQYGLIAQELESVLPSLVKNTTRPQELDSLGNEVHPETSFKVVNYSSLIPVLIAGMKEQQSIIDAQNEALAGVMDQLNTMQTQIDNCCSGTGFKNMETGEEEEDQLQKSSPNGNVLGQNTPNPFRSQTTISYTLEQGGKVVLNVYDKNGKVVANLEEAEQPEDNYRYEWDASGLPAGLYHYALYVDGELLVKKAIKLKD